MLVNLTRANFKKSQKSRSTLDVVYEVSHQVTYPQSDAELLAVKEEKESFTSRFQIFFSTLNQGIYGVEDLATRKVKESHGETRIIATEKRSCEA
ncbi:hypothetical protein TSAR_002304 [Trichomalopsis sarcophagae]|uniref:Uncharacterized protein n=1 Tax=Trichomalopsis sarcophagae TaxID=543379 RepID=A0A232EIS6_9HYME|nr:hypothetical protein TSAR_002304 [Trichomalopsis sarcophagae]